MKKDVYPLPRIDDTPDRLRHSRYFSSMDLKSGYWQIEVDERDCEKTASVTPDGLYEFKAMPFGLWTAPATFQRVMDTILADRGSSFMAQLTQEILRLSHTSHRRTMAHHTLTNGLTERLNKTIANMISTYVDGELKTLDEVLPYIAFAYNTAVQKTTGVTPFQLVHGRKVTTMLDAMLPQAPSVGGSDDAQVVVQRAREVRKLAKLQIKVKQRVDTGRYNLGRRDVHFQPGDRV